MLKELHLQSLTFSLGGAFFVICWTSLVVLMSSASGRVGSLDRTPRLSVYQRRDGSLFLKVEGRREDVHGNAHWTSTSGIKMRGTTPILAVADDSQGDVQMAIAASLQMAVAASVEIPDVRSTQDAGRAIGDCVVCMTDVADHLISPCHHLCLCGGCARRVQRDRLRCPVCRRTQRSIERVFFV